MCQSKEHTPISCHRFSSQKAAVFSGIWMNNSAVFKSVNPVPEHDLVNKLDSTDNNYSMETDFIKMVKSIIKSKFNIMIKDINAKSMTYIQYSQVGGNRYTEMQNVWSLIQDNEYLALSLYEKYDVFPKLLGTCGSLYAVEKMNSISGYWHMMALYDSQKEWEKRVKISLMILDFLHQLEVSLPEPLLLCDVKMIHFGVTNDFKKVKFLDLDSVHPVSVANKMTANGASCKEHSDCDLLDCRSLCNFITFTCQHGVVNNNLQIICERIFLGLMMSGRIMVPGLLFSSKAPPVLIEVLEQCANPSKEKGAPRSPADSEIRNRLFNLLTHLLL